MERMRTFLTYALLIIGFFVLSLWLENGLLKAMYEPISGELDGSFGGIENAFQGNNLAVKACNVNGYMSFDLVNTTGKFIDRCYAKIELYNHQQLLADTEYIEILGMQPNATKSFNIKFKANHIEKFHISIVENTPDKTNIIDILGWEIDLSNVFGLGIDLTNVTIFGTKLTGIFTWENAKATGKSFGTWFIHLATNIPLWGYGIGWLFIVGLL